MKLSPHLRSRKAGPLPTAIVAAGIEKLREAVGLPNVIGSVPVSFDLVFWK